VGNKGSSLFFYTNNPVAISIIKMPVLSGGRILVGQSIDPSVSSSLVVASSTVSTILPAILMNGDLNLAYSLKDPQFYNSYI
jgi:hypothetical protein